MPDGDRYHTGVGRRFQKPYRMLCEGRLATDALERALLTAVKGEIKRHDAPLLRHVAAIGSVVESALLEAGFDVTHGCSVASLEVDRLRYASALAPRYADLTVDAAKSYLHEVRYGRTGIGSSPTELILTRVFDRCYRTEFEAPVLSTVDHYGDADPREVRQQLAELRPRLAHVFRNWAERAIERDSLTQLRLPRRAPQPKVRLDENLL
jgi:hypothetical protein